MADITWKSILTKLVQGNHLTAEESEWFVDDHMKGNANPAAVGAVLATQQQLGLTADEIAGAAKAMVSHAVPLEVNRECTDIVGTVGDGAHTVNLSTMGAVIAAAAGVTIVKHGNRAVSSKCGSADALEGLGVNLDVNPAEVGKILHDQNFVFLFAQRFHPCFRNIAPIRNELGIRTLFNLLGPLINPSRPTHILLGVARPNLVKLMAETLAQSSVHRAAVVCGAGGYDEITPIGPNEMIILDDGKLEPLTLDPADYGIPACTPEDLAVSSRDEAVAVLRELLAGRGPEAMRNMLALNVGMSIYLLEGKLPLATCIAKAREALASGVGGRVLHAA
mgnify:CR=1 FL=1